MSIYRIFMLIHQVIQADTSEIHYAEDVVLTF